MADIFISYKREDRDKAEALARFLENHNYSVWWDTSLQAGESFTDVIQKQIDDAQKVVVLWSKVSVNSIWVRAEAARGIQQGKLVAARIEPCDLPLPFTQIETPPVEKIPQDFEKLLAPIAAPVMVMAGSGSKPTSNRWKDVRQRLIRFSRLSLLPIVLVAAAAVLAYALHYFAKANEPQWSIARTLFIGTPIPLAWTYGSSGAEAGGGAASAFQIQSDTDPGFTSPELKSLYTEGRQRPVPHVNGTRYWRLRAVTNDQKKQPLTGWSSVIRITQFDSSYRRIEADSEVIIGLSDTDYDDEFKWKDSNNEWHGIDVELARAIVTQLQGRVGWHLNTSIKAVPWTQLLDLPKLGEADMILSAISKRPDREEKYELSFSDTYFCTTQALLFRASEAAAPVADMIKGRRVGYEDNSTSAQVVTALKAAIQFTQVSFARPEIMLPAILNNQIDLAVVDAPFADDARRNTKDHGADRLAFREFQKADFPASFPQQSRRDQYAIGLHANDELLAMINEILAKFKTDGTLAKLFAAAVENYARGKGTGPTGADTLVLHKDTWQCPQ